MPDESRREAKNVKKIRWMCLGAMHSFDASMMGLPVKESHSLVPRLLLRPTPNCGDPSAHGILVLHHVLDPWMLEHCPRGKSLRLIHDKPVNKDNENNSTM